MVDKLSSNIKGIDFKNELADVKNLIQKIEEQITTNDFNAELTSLNQEIKNFEGDDKQNTIEKFEDMINSLVLKIDQIERESNINFDEYQEKLELILSSKKQLLSLSNSVNNPLDTEAGRVGVAQIGKEQAAKRISSDIGNLSKKSAFFRFFENRV